MKDGKIRTGSVGETMATLKTQLANVSALMSIPIVRDSVKLLAIQEQATAEACIVCPHFKSGCDDNPCPAEMSVIYEDTVGRLQKKMNEATPDETKVEHDRP